MNGREIGYFQEGLKGPTDALFMAVHEKVKNIYDMRLAYSLYGVFPVPLGQFVSVTYPRRTGGEHIFAWIT